MKETDIDDIVRLAGRLEEMGRRLLVACEAMRAELARREKPKKKKERPKQNSAFDAVLNSFATIWQGRRYRTRYIATGADKKLMGELMQKMSREEVMDLPEMFARYIDDTDPFTLKQGHSLRWFCQNVNKYKGAKQTVVVGHARAEGTKYTDGEIKL